MAYKGVELLQVGKVNSSLDQNGSGLAVYVAMAEAWEPTFFGAVANKVLG